MKDTQSLQATAETAKTPISEAEDDLDIELANQAALTWKPFLWIIAGVLATQLIYGIVIPLLFTSWTTRSAFGDMFGAINTFFSGLAFAGVIYAIVLQRRELQLQRRELILQRRELELTREELQRSASAQEKSEKALKDQVEELVHQRQLSILPGFILFFDKRHTNAFSLKNIGSGVALNVQAEDIPLEGYWINIDNWCNKYIKLQHISHVMQNVGSPLSPRIIGYSSGEEEELIKKGISLEKRVTGYLEKEKYTVTLYFNDIEGIQYTQQIDMSAGRCIPHIVKRVN